MTVTALPAPTPTELAAVRARLQRRSWPSRQAPYGSAALSTTTQVVLMGGGFVLILVAVFVGSAPVSGAAMSLFQAGLALTGGWTTSWAEPPTGPSSNGFGPRASSLPSAGPGDLGLCRLWSPCSSAARRSERCCS